MENEAFADVRKEGETIEEALKDLEKETPAESQPDTKPDEEKAKEGESTPEDDNLPFHKHPRWIERDNELKEAQKELADLKAFQADTVKKLADSDTDIPDWFKELYGDNDVAWKKYSEREAEREQEIEKRILERQTEAQKKQAEAAAEWNRWIDGEIGKLEADGLKFDRNALLKTMQDYRPTDERGQLNFRKGYDIHEALNRKDDSAHSQARKSIADTTTKSSGGDKAKKDYLTPGDLRNTSWHNL